jgi:hypothetical protein
MSDCNEIRPAFDRDWCHDYVVAHGMGLPNDDAFLLAETLYEQGDSYADIAFEIVAREMTVDIEGECNVS